MRRALLLIVVGASCAVGSPQLAADHPASPSAPTGVLAGAPPSLRPGVVKYDDVPALRTTPPPAHHHHGS